MKESMNMINNPIHRRVINEALAEQLENFAPSISQLDAVQLLTLFPGFDSSLMAAETIISLPSEDSATRYISDVNNFVQNHQSDEARLTKILRQPFKDIKPKTTPAMSLLTFKLTDNGKPAGKDFAVCMFQMLKDYLIQQKKQPLMKTVKPAADIGAIVIDMSDKTAGDETLKILNSLHSDKNVLDMIQKMIECQRAVQSAAKGSPEQAAAKKQGQQLKQGLPAVFQGVTIKDLTDEERSSLEGSIKSTAASTQIKITGNIVHCIIANLLNDNSQTHTFDMMQLADLIDCNNTLPSPSGSSDFWNKIRKHARFFNNIKILGNPDARQRKILQMLEKSLVVGTDAWKQGIKQQISALDAKRTALDMSQPGAEKTGNDMYAQREMLAKFLKTAQPIELNEMYSFIARKMLGFKMNQARVNLDKMRKNIELTQAAAEKNNTKYDMEAELAKLPPDPFSLDSIQKVVLIIDGSDKSQEDIERQRQAERMEQLMQTNAADGYTPNFSSPLAKRRWKIFDHIKHLPGNAIVVADSRFAICLSRTKQHLDSFAITKPKVDSQGNAIDGTYLWDEEGITPENKRLRDSKARWTRDGLYPDEMLECGWCTSNSASVNGGIFSGYSNGHRCSMNSHTPKRVTQTGTTLISNSYMGRHSMIDNNPWMLQILDGVTGYMYQCGESECLDESDGRNGLLDGRRLSTNQFIEMLAAQYQSFKDLINASGIARHMYGKNVGDKQKVDIVTQGIMDGVINADGSVNIRSDRDFGTYGNFIMNATKIYVCNGNEQISFCNLNNGQLDGLPPVDLSHCKNARSLFYNVKFTDKDSVLRIMNSEGVQDMSQMFYMSELVKVEGLKTDGAATIELMFSASRKHLNVSFKLEPNVLDLSNCRNMKDAFNGSFIESVVLKNTDNITSAARAFVGCRMLVKTPDIRFKSIAQIDELFESIERAEFIEDPDSACLSLFSGCPKLAGDSAFDKAIAEITEFYKAKFMPAKNIEVSDDGFVILKNKAQIQSLRPTFYYKYRGVRFDKDFAEQMNYQTKPFEDINGIMIRTLDLTGVKSTTNMFYGCANLTIKHIINADQVKTCASMFYKSRLNICPDIDMPNVEDGLLIFKNAYPFLNAHEKTLKTDASGNPEIDPTTGKPIVTATETLHIGVNRIDRRALQLSKNATTAEDLRRYLFGDTYDDWNSQTDLNMQIPHIFGTALENQRNAMAEALKISNDGVLTVTEQNIELIPDVLAAGTVKTIKFSPEIAQKLNANSNTVDVDGPTEETFEIFRNVAHETKYPIIDLDGVTSTAAMFRNKSGSVAGFKNFQQVRDTNYMFCNAIMQTVDMFDMSAVTTAISMFLNASIGSIAHGLNLAGLVHGQNMFKNSTLNASIYRSLLVSDSATMPALVNATGMFYSINGTCDIDLSLQLPAAVHTSAMFFRCGLLRSIKKLSMPHAESLLGMFNGTNIRRVVDIDMPAALNMTSVFNGCHSLSQISKLRINGNAQSMEHMFYDCPNLKIINIAKTTSRIGSTMHRAGMFTNCPLQLIYGENGEALIARMNLLV